MEFETLEMLRGFANLLLMTAFLIVGHAVHNRSLSGHERTANVTFTYWWVATAALMAVRAIRNFVVAFGDPELALFIVETQLSILIGATALGCLTFYFAYLFTGEHRLWIPIVMYYAIYAVFLLYIVADQRPIGLELSAWRLNIIYEQPHPTLGRARSAVLLFIPPLLGIIGYMSLFKTVPTRLQRFRIGFVSIGLLVWISSYFLAYIFEFDFTFRWSIAERVIGIVAALLILIGYRPPARWRQRLEAPP